VGKEIASSPFPLQYKYYLSPCLLGGGRARRLVLRPGKAAKEYLDNIVVFAEVFLHLPLLRESTSPQD
jgi:hypothetical protein